MHEKSRRLVGLLMVGGFGAIRRSRAAVSLGERFLGGAMTGYMDTRALGDLTTAAYDARGDYLREGLFAWERAWFEESLAPLEATKDPRILIGGMGTGREVSYFLERGWSAAAFDPSPRLVAVAKERFAEEPRCRVLRCSYEELPQLDKLALEPPFDAVLLGWGSLTHVPSAAARIRLLEGLRALCPAGPVLASFWKSDPALMSQGRAFAAGRKAARLLGGRFPSGDDLRFEEMGSRSSVAPHAGYVHFFCEGEIRELAARSGYAIEVLRMGMDGEQEYPHATLRPIRSESRRSR